MQLAALALVSLASGPAGGVSAVASRLGPLRGEAAARVSVDWVARHASYEVRWTPVEVPLGASATAEIMARPRLTGHCGDLARLTADLANALDPSLRATVVEGWYRPVWSAAAPTEHVWVSFALAGRRVPADPTFAVLCREAELSPPTGGALFCFPSLPEEWSLFRATHYAGAPGGARWQQWAARPLSALSPAARLVPVPTTSLGSK